MCQMICDSSRPLFDATPARRSLPCPIYTFQAVSSSAEIANSPPADSTISFGSRNGTPAFHASI